MIVGLLSGRVQHFRQEPFDRLIIEWSEKSAAFVLRSTLDGWRQKVHTYSRMPMAQAKQNPEPFHLGFRHRRKLEDVLERAMLIVGDQMLVSGFAVLLVAFVKSKTLSAYHFCLLTDLAWQASNAQQLTVTLLYPRLRKNKISRFVRLFMMWATAGLLLGDTVIQGNDDVRYDTYTCPAICLFWAYDSASTSSGSSLIWMLVNIVLVLYAYFRHSVLVFRASDSALARFYEHVERVVGRADARINQRCIFLRYKAITRPTWPATIDFSSTPTRLTPSYAGAMTGIRISAWKTLACLLRTGGSVVVFLCRLFDSSIVGIVQQAAWFALTTYDIATDRLEGARVVTSSENAIGVGQFLPLILLLVPALALLEVFEGE